jgi:peptide/nickel transport system ATP-binding protein
MAILSAKDLAVSMRTPDGRLFHPVNRISFEVGAGEIVCLVGESGCGKSTAALALMQLLPDGAECSGEVNFGGRDLAKLPEDELCRIRGARISMVFQEPMTALNPVQSIGRQVMEPILVHQRIPKDAARARAVELLERVGIPNVRERIDHFPHQLSGGQRQRVVIAMALACKPDLIIADEPTTALDTTVQRQILDLLVDLVEETGIGLVLITHNLAIVSELADRVMVMYAGRIVETGTATEVFANPKHPYTRGLLAALAEPGQPEGTRLKPIRGSVPALVSLGAGCAFADRCDFVQLACRQAVPESRDMGRNHLVSCFFPESALERERQIG